MGPFPRYSHRPFYHTIHHYSAHSCNDIQVDLCHYPLYGLASPRMFVLKPGQSLYIPSHYWHWIFSEPESEAVPVMSLSFWTTTPHRNLTEPTLIDNEKLISQSYPDWPQFADWMGWQGPSKEDVEPEAVLSKLFNSQQQSCPTKEDECPSLEKELVEKWVNSRLWSIDTLKKDKVISRRNQKFKMFCGHLDHTFAEDVRRQSLNSVQPFLFVLAVTVIHTIPAMLPAMLLSSISHDGQVYFGGKFYEPFNFLEWAALAYPNNRTQDAERSLEAWGKKNPPNLLYNGRDRLKQTDLKEDPLCVVSYFFDMDDIRVKKAPHIQNFLDVKYRYETEAEADAAEAKLGRGSTKEGTRINALMWIANKKYQSGLHHDTLSNTLTILSGTKYVAVYSPFDTPYVYPYLAFNESALHPVHRKMLEQQQQQH